MNKKYVEIGNRFETKIEWFLRSQNKFEVRRKVKIFSGKLNDFTEIDLMAISGYDIILIEAKRAKVSLYGDLNDYNWIAESGLRGLHRYWMHNPVLQNYEHIRSLKRYLHIKGINTDYLRFYNYVVVPEECDIFSDCTQIIHEEDFAVIMSEWHANKHCNELLMFIGDGYGCPD